MGADPTVLPTRKTVAECVCGTATHVNDPTNDPITDCGNSRHLTHTSAKLTSYTKVVIIHHISMGDGRQLGSARAGVALIDLRDASKARIRNVPHVPNTSLHLISVGECTRHGICLLFERDKRIIRKGVRHLATVDRTASSLYCMSPGAIDDGAQVHAAAAHIATLWHQCLGHINDEHLRRLGRADMLPGHSTQYDIRQHIGAGCILGRATRASHPRHSNALPTNVLDVVWSDVCGPFTANAFDGNRHVALFKTRNGVTCISSPCQAGMSYTPNVKHALPGQSA